MATRMMATRVGLLLTPMLLALGVSAQPAAADGTSTGLAMASD